MSYLNQHALALGYESSSARWEGIERTLQTNGYSYSHCRQLKHAWESFIIESMDYSNDLLTSLKQKVADSVRNYEANNSDYTMISLIDTVANELRIDFSKRHMADYIQVAIVNYLCSNHEQLPEINSRLTTTNQK